MEKKYIVIPLIAVVLAGLVIAGVLYANSSVDIQVNEALSTANTSLSVGGYPGETKTETITIKNLASVSLKTQLAWAETTNPSNVTYTTNMPLIQNLPNGNSDVSVIFTFANDTAIGNITGNIQLTRI